MEQRIQITGMTRAHGMLIVLCVGEQNFSVSGGTVECLLTIPQRRKISMLENIAIFLLILWIFGLVSANAIAAPFHLLLVAAIAIWLTRFIRSRRI